jgi:membrane dipeptidase
LIGAGKIAAFIGIENGVAIADTLANLKHFYDRGVRYMTLTHMASSDWCISSADTAPAFHGLTEFGWSVVREMNRLGMLVDLSHVSDQTMNTVLDVSKAPVIFSHSSARAINGHPRNVPDAVLKRVAINGGIGRVNFSPDFVSEAARSYYADVEAETARLKELMPGDAAGVEKRLAAWKAAHPEVRATLRQVADHIDHVRKVAGTDHVGLGSDFDGISRVPAGLEDVSRYPDLLEELVRKNVSVNFNQTLDLRRLESTEDVTGKVRAAVKSTDDTLATAERNGAIAALLLIVLVAVLSTLLPGASR